MFGRIWEEMEKVEGRKVRVTVVLDNGRKISDVYEVSPWSETIVISGMIVPVKEVEVWLKRMWGSKIKKVLVEEA